MNKFVPLCDKQESKWAENREFIDEAMTFLRKEDFISRYELLVVAGILEGGVSGKLLNKEG